MPIQQTVSPAEYDDAEDLSVPTHDLRSLLRSYERSLILSALQEAGGNQRRAAEALGVLPTTLHEKMKRLGIPGRYGPHGYGPRAAEDPF